jgi:hypothetical protein
MGLADALIPGLVSNASNLVARKQLKYKEFTSSGNFIIGSGGDASSVQNVYNIILVGGGGGGGMGSVTLQSAGTISRVMGGPGGGGEVRTITATGIGILGTATSGTITVTIGAGGVGGAASNGGTAAVGGDSKFGELIARGGGKGGSWEISNATNTNLSASTTRATEAGEGGANSRGTVSTEQVLSNGGAGGGVRYGQFATTSSLESAYYLNGPQNGRDGGFATENRNPDFSTTNSLDNNNSLIPTRPTCGLAGRTAGVVDSVSAASTAVGGFFGAGGQGLFGMGGGAAGGVVSRGGTTVALALETPATWSIGVSGTAYNAAPYISTDGGGRGAVVTGDATANYIAATSGSANTGGGGGGGAAFGSATTYYNSVHAGGSGASGYCVVYWWE